ncbi:MAG: TolC family protein [Pseudomonadota bacterium]
MWRPRKTNYTGVVAAAAVAWLCTPLHAQAPASPDEPWPIPAGAGARALSGLHADGNTPPLDFRRPYDLPALIDLAQRSSPETRAAWEVAREAAADIGLVESAYLPQLSLQALGGFEHTPLPAPKNLVPAGYFVSNTHELIPALAIKWLLFDFGQRAAKLEAVRADSFVANVSFTAAHQKLVFTVSQAYFNLGAAQGRFHAAQKALSTAGVSLDATTAKRANGLATVVAVAQTERQAAQARYNLAQAEGAVNTAQANLVAALGIPADSKLEVVDSSQLALPPSPSKNVAAAIRDAFTHRPDVIAALGLIDSAEAALKSAELSHRPVIEMSAHAFQNFGSVSSDGRPYSSVDKPGANILFLFKLPLLDGGERASRVSAAKAKVRQAEARLAAARDAAATQVVKAHNDLVTSLAAYEAADAVGQAARTSYDAALRSYQQGVGTYTDLAAEENAMAQAEAQIEDARAAAHSAAAAMAFAMGSLQSDTP